MTDLVIMDTIKQRIYLAIKENDFNAFVRLLGATDEEKLENSQLLLCNADDGKAISKPKYTKLTPFLLCAQYGRCEMLEYMCNISNININQQSDNKYNALTLIILSHDIKSVDDATKCAKLLLAQKTFDITIVDDFHRNLLIYAAKSGKHYSILRMLLKRKQINVNLGDTGHRDALFFATVCQHAISIRLLVREPTIQINRLTEDEQPALYYFTLRGHRDSDLLCCRQFVDHPDVDVSCIIRRSDTAVVYALDRDNYFTHALLTHGRL
jgi:hypothetical protein